MTTQILQTSIMNDSLIQINWSNYEVPVAKIHHLIKSTIDEPTGWLHLLLENHDDLLNSIQRVASEIKLLLRV